jgi:hypothetical protein
MMHGTIYLSDRPRIASRRRDSRDFDKQQLAINSSSSADRRTVLSPSRWLASRASSLSSP